MKIKKQELPFVSIIVLNYNGEIHLNECFNSLNLIDYPKDKYEVLMGDNASSDGSVEYVKKLFKWVKIIEFDRNYGFAEGNNKAVECTSKKSKYIAFLNNDTKVDKKWLVKLVPEVRGRIVAAASKVFFYDCKNRINFGGGKLTAWGFPYEEGYGELDKSKFNKKKWIHHSTGCAMLVNKKVFLETGGFDSDYHSYHEDVDLGWRFWLYGYKVIYVPTSIVYHKGSGTLGASPFKILLMGKNIYSTIIKNFGMKNLIISLVGYSIFHFLKFIMLLILGKFNLALAHLKVYVVAIKELKMNLKKRKIIQKNRKISDEFLKRIKIITPFMDSLVDMIKIFKSKDKLKI